MTRIYKQSILAISLLTAFSAGAADYSNMVFECSDGSLYSISAENLSISIAEDKLIASNGSESLELAAGDVSRFFFGSTSSVAELATADNESPVTVYSIAGIHLGDFRSVEECTNSLSPGTYVVKSTNKTFKLQVK